jgi:hypothetical protein
MSLSSKSCVLCWARYQTYFVSSNQNSLFLSVRSPSLGDVRLSCDWISIVAIKQRCYSSIVLKFGTHILYTCTSWCGAWTQENVNIHTTSKNCTASFGHHSGNWQELWENFVMSSVVLVFYVHGRKKESNRNWHKLHILCVYQTHSYVHSEWKNQG